MSELGFDLSQEGIERALNAAADEVILGASGALARNYKASGLYQRSGFAFKQVTQRGFRDNYVRVEGHTVKVGVDIWRPGSHLRWLLLGTGLFGAGRGLIRPKYFKALHWVDASGRSIFRKSTKGIKPHDVYNLTAADEAAFDEVAARVLMGGAK